MAESQDDGPALGLEGHLKQVQKLVTLIQCP